MANEKEKYAPQPVMLEEFDLSSTCMTDRQPKGCRMDAEDKENGKTLVA